ncbi:MAG: hypothetical protein DRR16_23135 [Candidatus Parabeggiatoa sp. nov. 3]|nr:MAG: hypothetical protein DRR00_12705 [Gammaproteobacteria bacterium]RKZ65979.1 MAG: hypothetical protein DRQ99_11045 [Gammaproteobacteria bacterium]RKZ80863.1 MAG: hypothetical protein DRR16_23135 [Gammaproteobacteria bacterium]
MTHFDFDEFEKKLKKVTQEIFLSINSKNVCGFSLFSDSDAGSILASFNTISHLENNWKEYPYEDKEYYRWYPAEWFEEGIPNEELDNLSLKLFKAEYFDDSFMKHKEKVFKTIVNVLKELKDEGLFNSTGNDFVLVFYATDSEERQNELKWIKELNKEVLFKEYENWMQTWDV